MSTTYQPTYNTQNPSPAYLAVTKLNAQTHRTPPPPQNKGKGGKGAPPLGKGTGGRGPPPFGGPICVHCVNKGIDARHLHYQCPNREVSPQPLPKNFPNRKTSSFCTSLFRHPFFFNVIPQSCDTPKAAYSGATNP